MLLVPRTHDAHMHHAAPADLAAAGRALRSSLGGLRQHLGDIAYNIVFHSAPFRSEAEFHWHAHVVPKVATQAGFELGTGVPINICPPEVAANALRVGAGV
jgi:UDPglucose--hexose-1-phosphate uridylyltransferase